MNRFKICFGCQESKFFPNGLVPFYHSHEKQKDSLEIRAVLFTFLLEHEIFGVAVQSIHQNSKKWSLLGGIS